MPDDAAALALVANCHEGWSAADRRRLERMGLQRVGTTGLRELIRHARERLARSD